MDDKANTWQIEVVDVVVVGAGEMACCFAGIPPVLLISFARMCWPGNGEDVPSMRSSDQIDYTRLCKP